MQVDETIVPYESIQKWDEEGKTNRFMFSMYSLTEYDATPIVNELSKKYLVSVHNINLGLIVTLTKE